LTIQIVELYKGESPHFLRGMGVYSLLLIATTMLAARENVATAAPSIVLGSFLSRVKTNDSGNVIVNEINEIP
jgi:hypothetical protein